MGKHSRCIECYLDIAGVDGDAAVEIRTPLGFESDDLGAEVSEVHGTKRARPGPGKIGHPDAFQWERSVRGSALPCRARGATRKLATQDFCVVLAQRRRRTRVTPATRLAARRGGKMKKPSGTRVFYIHEEFPGQEMLGFGHLGRPHHRRRANTMLLHLVVDLEYRLFRKPFLDEPVHQILIFRAARGRRKNLEGRPLGIAHQRHQAFPLVRLDTHHEELAIEAVENR